MLSLYREDGVLAISVNAFSPYSLAVPFVREYNLQPASHYKCDLCLACSHPINVQVIANAIVSNIGCGNEMWAGLCVARYVYVCSNAR